MLGLRNKEEWLEACQKMLKYYQGETDQEEFMEVYETCLLCVVANDIKDFLDEECDVPVTVCSLCVWLHFEGEKCGNYADASGFRGDNVERLRQTVDEAGWWDMRAKMLEGWIERLEKEIKDERCL